jgi:hypothetical protein
MLSQKTAETHHEPSQKYYSAENHINLSILINNDVKGREIDYVSLAVLIVPEDICRVISLDIELTGIFRNKLSIYVVNSNSAAKTAVHIAVDVLHRSRAALSARAKRKAHSDQNNRCYNSVILKYFFHISLLLFFES